MGLVVRVLASYSHNPCSNLAEDSNFFSTILFETNENKQKRGRGWCVFQKDYKTYSCQYLYLLLFKCYNSFLTVFECEIFSKAMILYCTYKAGSTWTRIWITNRIKKFWDFLRRLSFLNYFSDYCIKLLERKNTREKYFDNRLRQFR